jgi:heme A synthase
MTERRRSFGPVVALGLAAGVLSAVASNRIWLEYTDPDQRVLDPARSVSEVGAQMPLALALALVVLACWGVVLVSRGRARRAVAFLALLAAIGVVAVVVYAWFQLPDQRPTPTIVPIRDSMAGLSWTAWYWVAAVASLASVVAAALAVAWCPQWPEMGSRYDAPGESHDDVPAEEQSNLDLWKSMDQGRDPTA